MKRAHRLRRPEQFQRVRREGRSWDSPILALNAAPSRRRTARCGFVVGKRMGGAVTRNRAKRRVREAVRLIYDHIAPRWDLVFVIRPAAAAAEFTEIQSTVEHLLRRANLWVDSRAIRE